jgi:hypothetical protein
MKDDVPVDSETLLMTDFVNLKIKPAQSFKNAHRDRMCVHSVECSYVYEYLCLYCVSKKILRHHKKHALHNKRRPETSTVQFNAER